MLVVFKFYTMTDMRVQYMSKETQEVVNGLVGVAQKLIYGLDPTPCFVCKRSFREINKHNPFIFIVLKLFFDIKNDVLNFACLHCCQQGTKLMDVIELYPTLKLHDVKKLMYYGALKKFVFNFVDTKTVLYKKIAVTHNLDSVLDQVMNEKANNEEIDTLRLVRENSIVAEDALMSLRVDYGKEYNFDQPLAFNGKLINAVNQHCAITKYHVEVYYKQYTKYSPFMVNYNRPNCDECIYCANKVNAETNHPVLHCSICGPTNPNYFGLTLKMMVPFWKGQYNYNKVYWKTLKHKGVVMCNLMLYAEDTRREQ
ncbi:me53 [Matsumuraeses phaseoli granulovirus]|uniref:Me53 n=1 Tax=Matsumuraeses phaseoli granulovirus TaxID=2760664 RepID=A0AAE7SYD0_9BBAC|nr:me53 [Matsumuraeses phaseoli granulovirus]QOD40091.1 me53 [Matsumuraeses phaseoli granulovirus]